MKQHYLPRMWLKNFASKDKWVWVYDRQFNSIRKLSLKSFASVNNLYSYQNKEGQQIHSRKDGLSKLEKSCATIIRKISAKDNISDKEKALLAYFIAILDGRLPHVFDDMERVHKDVLKKILEMNVRNGEIEIPKGVNLENVDVKIDKNKIWNDLFTAAKDFALQLLEMQWIVIHIEDSNFITSDNPLIKIPFGNHHGAEPMTHKDMIYFFSLSPQILLLLKYTGDKEIYISGDYDEEQVKTVNEIHASYFYRYLVAKERSTLEKLRTSMIF